MPTAGYQGDKLKSANRFGRERKQAVTQGEPEKLTKKTDRLLVGSGGNLKFSPARYSSNYERDETGSFMAMRVFSETLAVPQTLSYSAVVWLEFRSSVI